VERLTSEARGEIELEENVLVIRRIHVVYQVDAPEEARATVERVHGFHHDKCPIYRSISKAIDITTEYRLGTAGS
jgi:organic hydroperoxide reductase OsmC/OhrA